MPPPTSDDHPDIRLIVCDNDGCLLSEKPEAIDYDQLRPIAEHNLAAFASGGTRPPLTIATGRPAPFVELLLRFVQCEKIPAICEHGVFTYCLTWNEARRDPDITDDDLQTVHDLRNWMRREHPDWVLEAGKEATVSVYVPEGGDAVDRRMHEIRDRVERERWPMHVGRTVTYVNATLIHVNKATALRRMLSDLSIHPEHVLAIGDTKGDLVLQDMCGHFACPANAEVEVRQKADYVSPCELTAGVVDILEHFTGRREA